MRNVVLFSLCLLLIASCGKSKIPEGEVDYEITYPHTEVKGLLAAALPKEMNIVFKDTKMKTTIARGSFFEMIIISDEADESVSMYLDFDQIQIYCELTAEEVVVLKNSQPVYTITKTEKQDSVAGLWCTQYEVASADSAQPGDAWFTEALAVQKGAWFSSFGSVIGFPMEYDVERYGIMMHATAVSFVEKEINETAFEVADIYTKVDFETYEEEVQALFDLLLD